MVYSDAGHWRGGLFRLPVSRLAVRGTRLEARERNRHKRKAHSGGSTAAFKGLAHTSLTCGAAPLYHFVFRAMWRKLPVGKRLFQFRPC